MNLNNILIFAFTIPDSDLLILSVDAEIFQIGCFWRDKAAINVKRDYWTGTAPESKGSLSNLYLMIFLLHGRNLWGRRGEFERVELGVTSNPGGLSRNGSVLPCPLPRKSSIINALFFECWPRTSPEFCLLSSKPNRYLYFSLRSALVGPERFYRVKPEELLWNSSRDILSLGTHYSFLSAFLRQLYCSVLIGPQKIGWDRNPCLQIPNLRRWILVLPGNHTDKIPQNLS